MVLRVEGGVTVLCALLIQPECDLQTAGEYLVAFPCLKDVFLKAVLCFMA